MRRRCARAQASRQDDNDRALVVSTFSELVGLWAKYNPDFYSQHDPEHGNERHMLMVDTSPAATASYDRGSAADPHDARGDEPPRGVRGESACQRRPIRALGRRGEPAPRLSATLPRVRR